jgi:hypothetical protein
VGEGYIWFLFIVSIAFNSFAAVYLKWVRANETYIWFLFIMSIYVHVAETLIAAALCQRSVQAFKQTSVTEPEPKVTASFLLLKSEPHQNA